MLAPRVLAIDTALNACSVALTEGDAILAVTSEPMQRGHAERIAPMVHEVMGRAHSAFSALGRVVVTTGPGSFTGVRVGLSFARALALALSIPCIGVSTLEALALENGEDGWRGARVAAPGGAYLALFRDGKPEREPALLDEASVESVLSDYPAAQWAFSGATPDVVLLSRRGARLDPAHYPPSPLYLRAPDAKPAALRPALA